VGVGGGGGGRIWVVGGHDKGVKGKGVFENL